MVATRQSGCIVCHLKPLSESLFVHDAHSAGLPAVVVMRPYGLWRVAWAYLPLGFERFKTSFECLNPAQQQEYSHNNYREYTGYQSYDDEDK